MVNSHRRARDAGIAPGILATGPRNDLTDVAGVQVGHCTVIDERVGFGTSVTAIRPHDNNPYLHRVPAGYCVGSGYGKLAGGTQIPKLGELETPIVLFNTLSTGRAIEAIIDWTLSQPGCANVTSVNAVVGETNDAPLNDIRRRGIEREHFWAALGAATSEPLQQGCVGAGAGTRPFGFKGGIGSSSRMVPIAGDSFCVAALVQSNFDGVLQLDGETVGKTTERCWSALDPNSTQASGPVMIVVATDAPISDRNLGRMAFRAITGIARIGAHLANDSGDYAIAFSTHPEVQRSDQGSVTRNCPELSNNAMSGLFIGTMEAVEEAVYNSLFASESVVSPQPGKMVPSLWDAKERNGRPVVSLLTEISA